MEGVDPTITSPILLKATLVGNAGAGKSAIGARWVESKFSETPKPTIGVEFLVKTIEWPGTPRQIKMQLWDTAGQEQFRSISRCFYRNVHVALIVYDPSNRASFTDLQAWIDDVHQYAPEGCPLIIVRNKVDLPTPPTTTGEWVSMTEATEWCKHKGYKHFGVSAKTGVDVNEVMEMAIRDALAVYKEPEITSQRIIISDSCKTHGCCCSIIGAPPEHFKKIREDWGSAFSYKPRPVDVLIPEGFEFGREKEEAQKKIREKVSVDLLASAKHYLKFFFKIEKKYPVLLRNENILRSAFARYQNFLLLASLYPQERLYPIIDIELVWKAHLIRPISYEKDTTALIGRVYEHSENMKPRRYRERQQLLARTKELYEKEFKQPYIPHYLSKEKQQQQEKEKEQEAIAILDAKMLSMSFEDLLKDAMWLANLRDFVISFLKVAKEENVDKKLEEEEFLESSLKEYEEFFLSRKNVDEGTEAPGPGYNVDIFWHAHMMHPVEYKQDCVKLLNKIVNHEPWPTAEL